MVTLDAGSGGSAGSDGDGDSGSDRSRDRRMEFERMVRRLGGGGPSREERINAAERTQEARELQQEAEEQARREQSRDTSRGSSAGAGDGGGTSDSDTDASGLTTSQLEAVRAGDASPGDFLGNGGENGADGGTRTETGGGGRADDTAADPLGEFVRQQLENQRQEDFTGGVRTSTPGLTGDGPVDDGTGGPTNGGMDGPVDIGGAMGTDDGRFDPADATELRVASAGETGADDVISRGVEDDGSDPGLRQQATEFEAGYIEQTDFLTDPSQVAIDVVEIDGERRLQTRLTDAGREASLAADLGVTIADIDLTDEGIVATSARGQAAIDRTQRQLAEEQAAADLGVGVGDIELTAAGELRPLSDAGERVLRQAREEQVADDLGVGIGDVQLTAEGDLRPTTEEGEQAIDRRSRQQREEATAAELGVGIGDIDITPSGELMPTTEEGAAALDQSSRQATEEQVAENLGVDAGDIALTGFEVTDEGVDFDTVLGVTEEGIDAVSGDRLSSGPERPGRGDVVPGVVSPADIVEQNLEQQHGVDFERGEGFTIGAVSGVTAEQILESSPERPGGTGGAIPVERLTGSLTEAGAEKAIEQEFGVDFDPETDITVTDEGAMLTNQGRVRARGEGSEEEDIAIRLPETVRSFTSGQEREIAGGGERVETLLAGASEVAAEAIDTTVGVTGVGGTSTIMRGGPSEPSTERPALRSLGTIANVPETALGLKEIGEFGVEAGRQTVTGGLGVNIERESVLGQPVVTGIDIDKEGFASRSGERAVELGEAAVDYAQQNPAETAGLFAGSLVGSAAIMGGAARLSSRAGTATRFAIQPGEELLGTAGFRATRAVAGERAAQRAFPNQEPLIFSEEAAIRAGRRAVGTGREFSARMGRVQGETARPSRLIDVESEVSPDDELLSPMQGTFIGAKIEARQQAERLADVDFETVTEPMRQRASAAAERARVEARSLRPTIEANVFAARERFRTAMGRGPSGGVRRAGVEGRLTEEDINLVETEEVDVPTGADAEDVDDGGGVGDVGGAFDIELETETGTGQAEVMRMRVPVEFEAETDTDLRSETRSRGVESEFGRVQPGGLDATETPAGSTDPVFSSELASELRGRPGELRDTPSDLGLELEMPGETVDIPAEPTIETPGEIERVRGPPRVEIRTPLELELEFELETELEPESEVESVFEPRDEGERRRRSPLDDDDFEKEFLEPVISPEEFLAADDT